MGDHRETAQWKTVHLSLHRHMNQSDTYPEKGAWPVCKKYLLMVQNKLGECQEKIKGLVWLFAAADPVLLPETVFLLLAELLQLVTLTFPS